MSEVERYLDDMFDRLVGTGAAGRRALAETEDHLRAAAADCMARGLQARQAEHEAITRFGPPGSIARQLRRARHGGPLNRALSSAWLLAGLALTGLGALYLAAAVRTVASQWGHPDCRHFLAEDCAFGFPVTRHVAFTGTTILTVGVVLLLAWRLMTRLGGLAACTRYLAVWAGAWCAVAGAASYATAAPDPGGRLGVFQLASLDTALIASCAVATASTAAVAWSLTRSRRSCRLR